MATALFDFSAASIAGGFSTPYVQAGILQVQDSGFNAEVAMTFVGSQVRFEGWTPGTPGIQVNVDGAGFTDKTTTTGFNDWNVLATGLSDDGVTPHTLIVKSKNGSNNYNVTSCFEVTGITPLLGKYTSYEPAYSIHDYSAYLANEGGCGTQAIGSTAGAPIHYKLDRVGCSLRFRATTPALKMWCWFTGQTAQLLIDDVPYGSPIVAPNTSLGGYINIPLPGGSGSAEHTYTILSVGGSFFAYSICTPGGTVNTTTPCPPRGIIALFGDSIFAGVGASDYYHSLACQLGIKVNKAICDLAATGATDWQYPGYSYPVSGEGSYPVITALPTAELEVVIHEFGTNDMTDVAGVNFGHHESEAQFIAALTNVLNGLIAGVQPTVKIYVVGIIHRNDVSDATRAIWTADQHTAIAACSAPSRIIFIDTTGWTIDVTSTNPGGSPGDGVHPTNIGHGQYSDYLKLLFIASHRQLTLAGVG